MNIYEKQIIIKYLIVWWATSTSDCSKIFVDSCIQNSFAQFTYYHYSNSSNVYSMRFLKCILSTWYKSCNSHIIIYFLACQPGYTGRNCFDICPAPYYGLRCAKTCNCLQCHHINGCISTIAIAGNRSRRVQRSICLIVHNLLVSNLIIFFNCYISEWNKLKCLFF